MLKKMTSVRAPVEQVREVFENFEAWPQWMPGIRRVRILNRTAETVRVDMTTVMLGWSFDQRVDFHFQTDRILQKQIAGRFKKWETEWRLRPSENGDSTILGAAFDIDLGFLTMFVPDRAVANALNEWFSQLASTVEARVRKRLPPVPARVPVSPDQAALTPSTETLLQVFQTADGLEVWIKEQRFFIPASP
jgi:ribosome-associated toxin RatA of RatAB toxin-antitoxin module